MSSHHSSISRLLAIGITAGALVFGYSVASTAIEFPAAGASDTADPAPDPAAPAAGDPAPAAPDPAADPVDQDMILAGLEVYKTAGCRGCHGWAANGEREGPNPQGPSLRETTLTYDAIRMTIACGRPGTQMPYFWRDAYRANSTDCYGVTAADLGNNAPIRGPSRLHDDELDAVAYYIVNYLQGHPDITFEQCELFWGAGATRCADYPHG
jgi:hypothetical protein